MFTVFIDGDQGTTGLRVRERLAGRKDITLLSLPEEKRKNLDARAAMARQADATILCLPDAASRELVAALVEKTRPACVIAIDALAARSRQRLCATVQLSDTGIIPGSGVGNHRAALNRETLGVPVFAIGVPTVVDSATLAADILEESGVEKVDEERLRGEHDAFMVTTRDIDQQVRDLSKVVGYGINWALQDLEVDEINALLS